MTLDDRHEPSSLEQFRVVEVGRTPRRQTRSQFSVRTLLFSFAWMSLAFAMFRNAKACLLGTSDDAHPGDAIMYVFVMVVATGIGVGWLENRPFRGVWVAFLTMIGIVFVIQLVGLAGQAVQGW